MRRALMHLLALALAGPTAAQTPDAGASTVRTLRAERLSDEIHLDGRLDEAAWRAAGAAGDFTQSWPAPGAAATERTEARVLYTNAALYVGVRLYDGAPDSIAAQLARRDASGIYSDWVHVMVDSYHDRRTAFRFAVNPRGVKKDVFHFDDGNEDASWDAGWEVATTVDSLGWAAEFRIPLSQLRFGSAPGGTRTWGLQVQRDIARRDERDTWAPWTRESGGFVSRFGELVGLAGVPTPERLEVQPYTSAGLTRAPRQPGNPFYRSIDERTSAGADV